MLRSPSLVVVMLTSFASAQTTHVVGVGGFPDIAAALAVALAGDVILVQPGTYAGFQATVGVTIRRSGSGLVQIANTSTMACPVNERLHVVDLAFVNVIVNAGVVTLDRCTMHSGFGVPALQVDGARMHLQECTVGVGFQTFWVGSGLVAHQAQVTAVDSTFQGSHANTQIWWTHGSAGIELVDSTFHGSRLVVTGGNGFPLTSATPPGHALRVATSTVFVSDSTLVGGGAVIPPTQPLACPVVGATQGRLARCALAPFCAPGIAMNGPVLGVHRVTEPQAGALFQLDFHTEPNAAVGVFASPGLGALVLPQLEQAVLLDAAMAMPLAVLVANGLGLASGSWTLPSGTTNLTLWLQGVATGPLPLQTSPVVGGVVR